MKHADRDLLLAGLFLVWCEARAARRRSELALRVLTADPLAAESLKKRIIDRLLDVPLNLLIPD